MEFSLVRWYRDRRLEKKVFLQLREEKEKALCHRVVVEGLVSGAGAEWIRMGSEDYDRWAKRERNILFSFMGSVLLAGLVLAPISIPVFCAVVLIGGVATIYLLQR